MVLQPTESASDKVLMVAFHQHLQILSVLVPVAFQTDSKAHLHQMKMVFKANYRKERSSKYLFIKNSCN